MSDRRAARPCNDEIGQRSLVLVQSWPAPSGALGELIVELRADHLAVWLRWDEDFSVPMDGQEDWDHFCACVWPVLREVVDAFRGELPLDAEFLTLVAEDRDT